MGVACKLVLLGLVAGAALSWHCLTKAPAPPPRLERVWWGKGEPTKQDESIRPFVIDVSEQTLEDLNTRLAMHKAPSSSLESTAFEYGFNSAYLDKLVGFWRTQYDWRERETFLNKYPQFKTRVQGLNLHYIHVKPVRQGGVRVLPLLLLHGWPGSVREFYDMIPLLTTPRTGVDYMFEVIAPSLAGYGFSEGAAKPGLGATEMSVLMHNLMERIGHSKYYAHGGDWGSIITTNMAILYPENILGLHVNMGFSRTALSNLKTLVGSFLPSLVVDKEHERLMYPLREKFARLVEEMGYLHIQATKPDTVGVALGDSPVGLAAYILEKFSTWSDPEWRFLPDGGLADKYTLPNLLDNVMIYWVTGSITTSMRLYSETFNKRHEALGLDDQFVTVPSAIAAFPNELMYQPPGVVRDKYVNLVRYTHMARGGHFAAFEEPALLADDLWTSVGQFEDIRIRAAGKDEL